MTNPEPGPPIPPPHVPQHPAGPPLQGQPYGAQPYGGQPYSGQPYGQPAGPPPLPPNPRPKKSIGRRIVLGVIALGLVIIGVLAWKAAQHSPDAAKVGDCVSRVGTNDIKIVSCTDSTAAFKVVGKVNNQTEAAFQISTGSICKPFPAAKSAFWKGKVGSTGYVLCLGPVK
jgi:hypothetical protein